MKNYFLMFFFTTMIMGTLISISAYSWFCMWIGLEINLLSIIPLFKSNKNYYPAESTLKYFITQAMASTVILFSIIISLNNMESFSLNYYLMMIMNSAFLTKLGAAPFHFWFPEVAEGLNWFNNLLLLTWQKIAPSLIIMYNLNMTWFFSFIIISSSIIGGLFSFNQTSLRKILAYSSINHIGWLIASMMFNKMNWILYFLIYSLLTLNIVMIFFWMKIYKLSQFLLVLNYNKMMKILLTFNIFSLGGLPPFLGFFPKWIVINNLIYMNYYTLSLILILFNLIMLFVYMRITLLSLTFIYNETIIVSSKLKINLLLILNCLTLMGLFICTNLFSSY